jgi:hypothetical protein
MEEPCCPGERLDSVQTCPPAHLCSSIPAPDSIIMIPEGNHGAETDPDHREAIAKTKARSTELDASGRPDPTLLQRCSRRF